MNTLFSFDSANAAFVHFATTDVLKEDAHKVARKHDLLRAMLLNYAEHQAVRLYFRNSAEALMGIECSVIAVTDEHVMLRSGIVIPVQAIVLIDLL